MGMTAGTSHRAASPSLRGGVVKCKVCPSLWPGKASPAFFPPLPWWRQSRENSGQQARKRVRGRGSWWKGVETGVLSSWQPGGHPAGGGQPPAEARLSLSQERPGPNRARAQRRGSEPKANLSRGPPERAGCPAHTRPTVPQPGLSHPQGAQTVPPSGGRGQGDVLSLLDLSHPWRPYPIPGAPGRVWLFFKLFPFFPARSDWAVQHRQGRGLKHREEGGLFKGSKQRTRLGRCCWHCTGHDHRGGRQARRSPVARAIPVPGMLAARWVRSPALSSHLCFLFC